MGLLDWLKPKPQLKTSSKYTIVDLRGVRNFGIFPKQYGNRNISVCLSSIANPRFDFTNIPCAMFSEGKVKYEQYLLDGENQQNVKQDILLMNYLVDNARIIVSKFDWKHFDFNHTFFSPEPVKDRDELSEFIFAPYFIRIEFEEKTETGNPPKYPYKIIYYQYTGEKISLDSEYISATFEYLQNGTIGRVQFTQFNKGLFYTVHCSLEKKGGLSIQKIETQDKSYNRVVVYTRPK